MAGKEEDIGRQGNLLERSRRRRTIKMKSDVPSPSWLTLAFSYSLNTTHKAGALRPTAVAAVAVVVAGEGDEMIGMSESKNKKEADAWLDFGSS